MVATEAELAAILDHRRSLVDVADQLDQVATERSGKAEVTRWAGEFRDVFVQRFDPEVDDLLDRIRGLRSEADA